MKKLLTILCLVFLVSCSPPDGPNERFYENGQLYVKENYKNGKRDGLYESFYENYTRNLNQETIG